MEGLLDTADLLVVHADSVVGFENHRASVTHNPHVRLSTRTHRLHGVEQHVGQELLERARVSPRHHRLIGSIDRQRRRHGCKGTGNDLGGRAHGRHHIDVDEHHVLAAREAKRSGNERIQARDVIEHALQHRAAVRFVHGTVRRSLDIDSDGRESVPDVV